MYFHNLQHNYTSGAHVNKINKIFIFRLQYIFVIKFIMLKSLRITNASDIYLHNFKIENLLLVNN